MTDFVDATAFNFEQGQRARKLFAAVSGLMEFVSRGVRTSVALSREESERRQAAELAEAAEAA